MSAMSAKEYVRRPRNHACTHCKQMKVRCEGEKNASLVDPCRRCMARGLECVVDSSFKRTPARQRAKAIEAELTRLRHEVEQQHMQSYSLPNAYGPMTPFSTPSPSLANGAQVFVDPAPSDALAGPTQDDNQHMLMLGSVGLTQQEVQNAFEIYRQHFHWQLAILDIDIDLDVLHACSPFLFWTIVVITRQRFANDDAVAKQTDLTKYYLALLKSTILEPPLSLHTIQAIVLLSFWPLPSDSHLRDPGWLYMDVAVSAAKYLDLDSAASRPSYHGGQLSQREMQIASRTWLAIFIVSSSLITFFGIKSNLQSVFNLRVMESAIHDVSTPPRLAAQASIMLITADYYGAIDSDMDLTSQDSVAKSCHHRLNQLPVVFARAWDQQLDYAVAACRLHMCTTVIVRNLRLSRPEGCSKIILAQASTFACQTLHKFHGLVKKPVVNGFGAMHTPRSKALPKNAMRHALNAVFFLLKFTCFNRDCPDADRNRALQALNGTVEALTEWSVRPNDEAARSCAALQTKLDHSELWQTQHLQINDRGSASIIWDSIRRSCRHRSRAAPRIPDLLELIDPTRCIKDKNSDVENIARSPAATDPAVDDLVWDDAMLEFFDLGSFDQSALSECAPVYGYQ